MRHLDAALDYLSPMRREPVGVYHPPQPDRFALIGTAVADATGRAQVDFNGPPRGQKWLAESGGINGGTLAAFYKNAEAPANLFDLGAPSPNTLDRNRGYPISSGEHVLVVFTGATPGATCTAHIEGARRYGMG